MHDLRHALSTKQVEHTGFIADIHPDEAIAIAGLDIGKRSEVAAIGKLVDIHDTIAAGTDKVAADGASDKSRAARDQYCLELSHGPPQPRACAGISHIACSRG